MTWTYSSSARSSSINSATIVRSAILLLNGPYRNKPHAWALHRLADCLRVVTVILASLGKWFDKLWADQPHSVFHGSELSTPTVGAGTRFHGDFASRELDHEGAQLVTHQPAAKHDPAVCCRAVQLEDIFLAAPIARLWHSVMAFSKVGLGQSAVERP